MIMGSKTDIDMMRSLVGKKPKPAVAPRIAPKAAPLVDDKKDELTPESLGLSLDGDEGSTTEFRVGTSRIRDGSREPTLETDLTALAVKSTTEPPSGETPVPAPVDGARRHPHVMPRVAPSVAPVAAAPAGPGQKSGMEKLVEDLMPKLLPALAKELAKQLQPLQEGLANLENRFNAFMKGDGDVPESFEMLNQELEELKVTVGKKADTDVVEAVDRAIGELGTGLGKRVDGVENTANEASSTANAAKSGIEAIMNGDAVPASFEALNGDVEEMKGSLQSVEGAAKRAWGESYAQADANRYTTDITVSRHLVDYLMDGLDEARAEKINELLGEFGEEYCKVILDSFVKNPKYVSEQLAEIRGYRLVQLAAPEENENPTDAIDARGFVDEKTDLVVQNAQYILESLNGASGDS